ncbi:CHAD domain-containing protein [Vibrio campbellii]|uniref:CHAD domain-containing protein n=1 Tax=Vibrio campbellii TaxID=680 RepID=UPI0005F00F19|nr:CHAD domain-containing protein [Vibrio campbellii]
MGIFRKPPFAWDLHTESDLSFTLPRFFAHEFCHVRQLELGVARGSDPEFNHQYRVTLRRIHSLSLLLKDVLPPFEHRLLKRHIRTLMKQTNQLRDLDVFVSDAPYYLNKHPEQKEAIKSVFAHISNLQTKEQQRVSEWLKSDCYHKTCILIENSLQRSRVYEPKHEVGKAMDLANLKITQHFQKVIKVSHGLTTESKDSKIHALRIECKKLRYLLDYFSPLYDSALHKANIKQLKHLQDCLGIFNDTSSQIAFFRFQKSQSYVEKPQRKAIKALLKTVKDHHYNSKQTIFLDLAAFRKRIETANVLALYS